MDLAGWGDLLKGIGTVGGAWATYQGNKANNKIQDKLLKAEEQRLNRDQAAQKQVMKAFGATDEEMAYLDKDFNFS